MCPRHSTGRQLIGAIGGGETAERLAGDFVRGLIRQGRVSAVHDLADGGLAIAAASTQGPTAIRDAIFKVTSKDGEAIHAGKADFAKALDLLKAGKPIRYEGVIGPVAFDQFGDITGPFRLWKIVDGKVTTLGEMSTEDVNAIKAKIDK